jgi:hypothetical protein
MDKYFQLRTAMKLDCCEGNKQQQQQQQQNAAPAEAGCSAALGFWSARLSTSRYMFCSVSDLTFYISPITQDNTERNTALAIRHFYTIQYVTITRCNWDESEGK